MNNDPQRLTYLDSTRMLMVLFVVLLHAACAYSNLIPWWQVRDTTGIAYDLVVIVVDGFALPVLFLVAGLFAPSSLARHGAPGFVLGKLKRFGIPTVLLLLTLLPLTIYVGYPGPESFGGFYLNWLSSCLDWKYYFIDSAEAIAGHEWDVTPMHIWFITMLLVFFAGYALFRFLRPRPKGANFPHFELAMLSCLAFSALGYGLLAMFMAPMAWAKLGPFFLFQPVRIPYYAGFFVMGVLLAENGWLESRGRFRGSWWLWLMAFLVSTVCYVITGGQGIGIRGGFPPLLALTMGLLRTATAFTACACFINLTYRFLSSPGRPRSSLADSSYDIYLLHLPLCVFLQAAFYPLAIGPGLKMTGVFLLSTALCWLASRLLHKIAMKKPSTHPSHKTS